MDRLFTLVRWLIAATTIVWLVSCRAAGLTVSVQATPASPLAFNETDFIVQGEFLQFFEAYGGVASLGHPISDEFIDSGWRVQYFEKGRLEYHPENEPAYRVTVGWLGDLLNRRQPPVPPSSRPPANAPDSRYYPQSGHTLSGDFLGYFETNGGSVRFGLPISEPFLLDGQLTQDFQSARFFWTPALDNPVVLEEIGRVHLQHLRSRGD